jgi:DNA polymerase-3 subunit delta'
LLAAGTHGDFRWVSVIDGKQSIGVDQVRAACDFVAKTAGYGSLKALVIEGADKLTTAAANALLKTLEEPQGDTLIMLISRRPWLLPATIRSRCQSRTLPRLSEATCNSALTQSGVSPESFDGKSSRFLENWLVAAANGTLDLQNEVRSSVTRVLNGKSGGRELTECLMKHELSDAVEATAQAIEERVSETNLDPKARVTLLTLHRMVAALLQRIRNGATPAREVVCYEIGVLTAGARENNMESVRQSLSLMGVTGA